MIPRSIAVVAAFLCIATQAVAADDSAPGDWITATNQPCKIWNPSPQPSESVTWSGQCKDGLADGDGVLLWTLNGKPDVRFAGRYANGKRNGHGVMILPNGQRVEGDWLNDTLLTRDGSPI